MYRPDCNHNIIMHSLAPEKVMGSLGRQLELETYLTKIELFTKRPHHLSCLQEQVRNLNL